MILCPNCGAKLPDRVRSCNFCQESFDPALVASTNPQPLGPATWAVSAYYAISGYFMLSGAVNFGQNMAALVNPPKDSFTFFTTIGVIFGFLTFLLGLGLTLRVEFVRGVANFVCGLKIFFGLLSAPSTIIVSLVLGPFGALLILMRALDIALAAFMIYLIGETDRRAPNI